MNVFVLNTGRCGSTTFIKACQHIENYTSSHESLAQALGDHRLAYPPQHIEADNRLSWFLGRLDKKFSDDAFYVHLKRNRLQTIESFSKRETYGIMQAYKEGILLGGEEKQTAKEIAADYIETVETNITLFLKDKSSKMEFNLESADEDFRIFWQKISAQGNLQLALDEWEINYNASCNNHPGS